MSLEKAFWLFFMLPLLTVIIGGYLYEVLKEFADDVENNRQRVRQLNQENHQLRDELARLKRQR